MADLDVQSGRSERHSFIQLASLPATFLLDAPVGSVENVGWTHHPQAEG